MGIPILSICVVTMNRAGQLKEALESCLACDLPRDTEFVIVDNASTDATETVVRDVFSYAQYAWTYEKMQQNLGCGGGRNYAFEKSSGKYLYMLDDDAVIDDKKTDFFDMALSYLEQNPKIVTLTTQIYDTAWGKNRLDPYSVPISGDIYPCYMFCGGSHFIRKEFFEHSPYLGNKYGYEEIMPSLLVADADCINAFCPKLGVIHKPAVDKWNRCDHNNDAILVNECAVRYAVKKMMYPKLFLPVLYLAYVARCQKHLRGISGGKKKADAIVQETMSLYPVDKRIKVRTALDLYKKFGLSVF